MKLHHIAIWTFRLEELKDFYVRFLGGTSNEKYINPKKGFESYFISFDEGPTLELGRCAEYPDRGKQAGTDTPCVHISQQGGDSSLYGRNAFRRVYHSR